MSDTHQMTLDLRYDMSHTLEDYVAGANAPFIEAISQEDWRAAHPYIYIWGGKSSGCTHILRALCHQVSASGNQAAYVPLRELQGRHGAACLHGLERMALIALDDVDQMRGVSWERALCALYNQVLPGKTCLIMSGHTSPRAVACEVPDWASRLQNALAYDLKPLSEDQDKQRVLARYASRQGLHLPEAVILFLIRYHTRNMNGLMHAVDVISQQAVAQNRQITLPFVQSVWQCFDPRRPGTPLLDSKRTGQTPLA